MERRFAGKVAAVTGAGSGLGREVARRLAAEGASVIVFVASEVACRMTGAVLPADGGSTS
jgi:NAD(P)-dependent dehydrogenase (short-subunit alcohol dehydrogenase family)